MMRGLFITFEGGEGAGKTTQARKLKDFLESKGLSVILTREPGGTPEAEKIRELLVQRDGGAWTPVAECALFFAARQMHVENLIRPALEAGKIVICDRFTDSTRAYQGWGKGFDLNIIEDMNRTIIGGFEPDLTIIFDLPVETGLERSFAHKRKSTGAENTEDRFENLDRSFHERMSFGYRSIALENPKRCRVIDATKTEDEVSSLILDIVKDRIDHVI